MIANLRSPFVLDVESYAGPLHVTAVDYHRNGASGAPFYVCLFEWEDEDRPKQPLRKMMGVLHTDVDDPDPSYCAVFDVDLLAEGCIEFMVNSWRGDKFENGLREAVLAWRRTTYDR